MPDTQPPVPPKASAQQILGAAPPRATRYRRAYILTAVFGTACAFGLLLVLGLFDGPHLGARTRSQEAAVPSDQTPQFGTFPGYDQVTAPAQLGKSAATSPLRTPAAGPLTPVVARAAAQPPLAPRQQATANPDAASQAAEKARQSPIFFTNTADRSAHDAGLAGGSGTPATTGYRPASASFAGVLPPPAPPAGRAGLYGNQPLPADAAQSLQQQKNSFIANAGSPTDDYAGAPEQKPLSPYEVQAGTIIPAALITAVNSDLPGDVIA
ncbi:MAG: hypothetical protein ACREFN_05670, partial [Acetobacteraceae bacterium]